MALLAVLTVLALVGGVVGVATAKKSRKPTALTARLKYGRLVILTADGASHEVAPYRATLDSTGTRIVSMDALATGGSRVFLLDQIVAAKEKKGGKPVANLHDWLAGHARDRNNIEIGQQRDSGGDTIDVGAGLTPSALWQAAAEAESREEEPIVAYLERERVLIRYSDSHHDLTEREIEPFAATFSLGPKAIYINRIDARCFLSGGETRTFVLMRVQQAADVKTGEVIPDFRDWLLRRAIRPPDWSRARH